MQDIFTALRDLRRPRLLIQAARHGELTFNRARRLKHLIGKDPLPGSTECAVRLLDKERGLDHLRKSGDAAYDIAQHVEVLTALMAETRLMQLQERS
ncbi:MAG: DUF6477 family protein [Shimia sp.]